MKRLVILCNTYPYREFFLGDELVYSEKQFQSIDLIRRDDVLKDWKKKVGFFGVFRWVLLDKLFWIELLNMILRFQLFPSPNGLKMMIKQLLRAHIYKEYLVEKIKKEGIDIDNTLFYAYWHDEKALALAMLKEILPNIKTIARGHGWDYDYKRNSPSYLPFKNFIVSSLDHSYTNSDYGKQCLVDMVDKKYDKKISVARMGKSNNRPVKKIKENKDIYTIVSCSRVIPLKRVDLIMKWVNELNKSIPVYWIHFGKEDEQSIDEIYKVNQFGFPYEAMGMVENSKILDYYSENYIDLYVNFSEYEGLSISTIEAQSAGIPALVTAVGGIVEVVNDTNGFLVDKDFDVQEVVNRILKYFQSDETIVKSKRDASYLNWKEKYNAEKNYSSFVEEIDKF